MKCFQVWRKERTSWIQFQELDQNTTWILFIAWQEFFSIFSSFFIIESRLLPLSAWIVVVIILMMMLPFYVKASIVEMMMSLYQVMMITYNNCCFHSEEIQHENEELPVMLKGGEDVRRLVDPRIHSTLFDDWIWFPVATCILTLWKRCRQSEKDFHLVIILCHHDYSARSIIRKMLENPFSCLSKRIIKEEDKTE